MNDRHLDIAAQLCVQFEGVFLKPYLCPARVPTIGIGATYYEDGRRVTMNDPPISRAHAMILLSRHLEHYSSKAALLSPVLVNETPERWGAIADFCLNVGVGAYKASTLRKRIDARDWVRAAQEIKRWNKGGGRVLPGLVARRQAEADLLLKS